MTFIGTGNNPEGPDLPLGFSMRLAQDPLALDAYSGLSADQREKVIQYVQMSSDGEDAANRVTGAVLGLRDNNLGLFGL